jgi:DNA adenine methylase
MLEKILEGVDLPKKWKENFLSIKLRPVIKVHGGKFYSHQWIISHFPKNYQEIIYIECCIGGGSVLLNKKTSVKEVCNDLDWNISNIFYVLVKHSDELQEKLKNISYSEKIFEQAKTSNGRGLVESDSALVTCAASEIVLRRFSRGGLKKSFAWSKRLRGGKPGDVNAWDTFKELLPKIIKRLENVEVYNMDVIALVKKYNQEGCLHYIDPPYLPTTRKVKNVYDFEMSEKKHLELAELLKQTKAKILLSGYQSDLYMKLYKDWNLDTKVIINHSSQSKKKERRVECLWKNF